MTDDRVEERRRHLEEKYERCTEAGDRHGAADTAASLRILNIWFPEGGPACS